MPYELPIRVYIPEAIKFVKECPFFDEEYALNIPRYRILSVLDEPTEECQLDVSGIETFVKTRRFFPKFYKYYPPITIYDDLELVVSLIQLLLPEIENFWSPYIEAPFILRLLSAGFIPIATKLSFNDPNLDYIVLLPKFHIRRSCIIPPKAIHIPKKATKWARGLDLTIDAAFNQVIVGIVDQHGENWMYSAIRKELYKLNCYQRGIQLFNHTDLCIPDNTTYNKYNASIHSVEIWRGDTLIAGEIGCLVGKVWTSITAFHSERNSGMVQLLSLASLLTKIGVHIFDLGMCMDYKTAIGANTLEREDFFSVFRKYKTAEKGDLYTVISKMRLSYEWSNDFGEWLSRISPRRQHLFILVSGFGIGSLIGERAKYERKVAGEFSDNYTLTQYTVNSGKIGQFEDKWNKNALVMSKKPGYEWTKLYKSIYSDNGDTQYLQLRKWRFKPEYDVCNEFSEKTVVDNVETVIDDSVGRNIPY